MVIAEPVYPADSPARSAISASAVASPALGTAAALKFQPTRAASSGAAHFVRRVNALVLSGAPQGNRDLTCPGMLIFPP